MAITLKDKKTGEVFAAKNLNSGEVSSPQGKITMRAKPAASEEAKPASPAPKTKTTQPSTAAATLERIGALGGKGDAGTERLAAGIGSVKESFTGGIKGVGAMLLNTVKDLDRAVDTQHRALENSADRLAEYERKAAEAKTDEQRKAWEKLAAHARRAAEVADAAEHPLDAPIRNTTEKAQEDFTAAGKLREEATAGLTGAPKVAADAALTVGNMLPAIGAGIVASPAAGAAVLASSSAGNAYLEKLAEGKDEGKARAYGAIVGALEGGLQYVLGGISKLGGGALKASATAAKIDAMEQGAKKAAAYLAHHGMREIGEEELQLFLEPLVNSVVFGEAYDAPTVEDMAYTAIVTALSTGALELPGAAGAAQRANTPQQTVPNAAGERAGAFAGQSAPQNASAAQAQETPAAEAAPQAVQGAKNADFSAAEKIPSGDVKNTSVDTAAATHTAEENRRISSYVSSTNEKLMTWVERVRTALSSGDLSAAKMKKPLGEVKENTAKAIKDVCGVDVTGFRHMIDGAAVQHINERHGAHGENDTSMTEAADIARVEYVLDNFDGCERCLKKDGSPDFSTQFRDKNNRPAPLIRFYKQIDGVYYAVEAAADSADKKVHIVTAYMGKKNDGNIIQALNMEGKTSPQPTPEAPHGPVVSVNTDNTVTHGSENVKIGGDDTLGAAKAGFDPYSHAEELYGTQDGGVNAVRPDDAPVSTDGKDLVSRSVVSVKGAAVTPDDFVPLIENETMRGGFSYFPLKNEALLADAEAYITENGWADSLRKWRSRAASGNQYNPKMNVVGQLLYNHAVNAGNYDLALDIFTDYSATLRSHARILQSARILKSMTPDNRLYLIQKSLSKFLEDAGVPGSIKLSKEVQKKYRDAKTEAERDAAIDEMQQEVAAQLPSTKIDQWNALRYVNMLGNFKTQARNISGNAGMGVLTRVKDGLAAGIEALASAASGGKVQRTKALFPGKDRIAAARADFDNVKEIALAGGRYELTEGRSAESDFMRGAMDKRTIFKNADGSQNIVQRTLEAYRRATNAAMERGDEIFSRAAYSRALAGYLKAHNVSAAQFGDAAWRKSNAAFIDKARGYAIEEAQEATFRDTNAVSKWLSTMGRGKNTPKAAKAIAEGVLPFRKTPANVLVRAEEYSPLGIVNTAVKAAKAAKGGEITAADVIDQLSKSVTGTGVFALGWWLAEQGLLRGGDDEDENQAKFDDLVGHQSYALELPSGESYTLDWLTPGSMPLFMGAELSRQMAEDGWQLNDVWQSLSSLSEPMLQMSVLSSVNDLVEAVRYGETSLIDLAGTALASYFAQGLTNSLLGQLERSSEGERMSTYIDKDSPLPDWLQRQLGKASAKVPGAEYHQYPYINAWGEREDGGGAIENLFSPGYSSTVELTALERELQRLANVGKTSVLPENAPKSFKIGEETHRLDKEAYVRYATQRGKQSEKLGRELMESRDYKSLTDEQKTDAMSKVFEYANAEAKEAVSDYEVSAGSWISTYRKSDMPLVDYLLLYEKEGGSKYLVGDAAEKMDAAVELGMSRENYIALRENIDANDNGSVSQAEAKAYLDAASGLTAEQKRGMWNIINAAWKKNPY